MNKTLLLIALSAFCVASQARSTSVNGYFKSNGTYVAPHVRTSPNATRLDNYSTQGNYNPYNGKVGTQPLFKPFR